MTNLSDSNVEPQRVGDARSDETLRTIFAEASGTMRHYSALQFAIQTLYLASMGALGSATFLSERSSQPLGPAPLAVWALAVMVFVTIFFLLLTLSCERHREHFGGRARKLEGELLHEEAPDVPRTRFIGATAALKGFYALSIALWSGALVWAMCFCN